MKTGTNVSQNSNSNVTTDNKDQKSKSTNLTEKVDKKNELTPKTDTKTTDSKYEPVKMVLAKGDIVHLKNGKDGIIWKYVSNKEIHINILNVENDKIVSKDEIESIKNVA